MAAAAETSDASAAGIALAEANINWERLDKTRFHVIGAILFTAQQGALHPTAVVKTRMQVAEGGLAHMSGFAVFRRILRSDGIPGVFRGFGTSAVGALPGRVLALTSLEVSKEMAFKYSQHFDMSEASRIAVSNGVAGLVSSIFSSSYFVPLDVICQRLMVQGLPGMPTYRGPLDVINKVVRTEGVRGLYRGFGITMLTQSPASALWWSSYGGAQHAIWRSLGYGNDSQVKPSHSELVAVQATAGTIAGACSSIITTPVDTIKTRLQESQARAQYTPPAVPTARPGARELLTEYKTPGTRKRRNEARSRIDAPTKFSTYPSKASAARAVDGSGNMAHNTDPTPRAYLGVDTAPKPSLCDPGPVVPPPTDQKRPYPEAAGGSGQ